MRRGLIAAALATACATGPAPPAVLDTANEACAWCRMAISDRRLAAQITAPGEEPRFFDDIGCLARHAADRAALPGGAVLYVADHRTGAWIRADAALYTHVPSLETPMGSHLVAHADEASRAADAAGRGGTPRTAAEVFGPAGAGGRP